MLPGRRGTSSCILPLGYVRKRIVKKEGEMGITRLIKPLPLVVLLEHRFIVVEKFLAPGGWCTFGGPCCHLDFFFASPERVCVSPNVLGVDIILVDSVDG